jgi:hypothetical protein
MKITKPDYFDDFKCLMGACKSSCCSAGWNIDVDCKSLERYSNLGKDFADITTYTEIKDGKHCFKLNEKGVCPFFRNDGLCDLVVKHGNILCDVCRDYPRFFNRLTGALEIGLGTDCEGVVQIVLNHKNKIEFVSKGTQSKTNKNEQLQLELRKKIFDIVQNRKQGFCARISNLFELFGIKKLFDNGIVSVLQNFEWLNFDGSAFVKYFAKNSFDCNFNLEDYKVENLIVCFVYRYFANKNILASDRAKIMFCVFMTYCCDKMQKIYGYESEVDAIKTICRQIEGSNINIGLLLDYFETFAKNQ